MANKLTNLVITKVALVDEGSCSAAHIKLYKRKEDSVMNFEEILKSLTPEQQAVVEKAMEECKAAGMEEGKKAQKTTMDEMEKKCGKLQKAKEDLEAEVAKLKNPQGTSDEEILKNVDPAIKAIIEKSRNEAAAATAAVKKMKEEADHKEALAKAKEMPNLGTDVEKLANTLQVLKGKDEKVYNDMLNILKAADAKLADGVDLGEHGTSVTKGKEDVIKSADAAWAAIEQAATEITKSKNCSKESAISQVINDQPELYNAYLSTLQ